jgi:hypothetical protein
VLRAVDEKARVAGVVLPTVAGGVVADRVRIAALGLVQQTTDAPHTTAAATCKPQSQTGRNDKQEEKNVFFFSPSLHLTGVALIARSQRGTILSAHKRKRTESKQHTCNRHLKRSERNRKNDDLADDLAEKHSDPADSAAKAHADS